MLPIVLHFVLGAAVAAGQTSAGTAQSQSPQQKPASVKLSPTEISELRAKAEQGDATAQFSLGRACEAGNGVPHNDKSAAEWYRKAADQGNPAAENRLGVMYRLGLGVSPDKEEAVRWYRRAAKQGNAEGMFNLGVSYYNGDGVSSDPTLAYAWFLLAKEAGNPMAVDAVKRSAEENGGLGTPDALQAIAAMYETGDGLPQNYSEAAKWYRKAADLNPAAAFKLASMLINGKGVPQDYGEAMALCRNAAKRYYAPAQYCVGFLYQKGLGMPVDPKEAAKWYGDASRGGNRMAMTALATMYWKGDGIAVDRPEAYYYFVRAYFKGSQDAKTQTQNLMKEMDKDEIKRLEKKLRDARMDPKKVFALMQEPGSVASPEESTKF